MIAHPLTAEDRERLRQRLVNATGMLPVTWGTTGGSVSYRAVVGEEMMNRHAAAEIAQLAADAVNALPSLLADSETLAKLREMRERIASELGYGCPVCHFWSETKHSLDCWLSDLLALLAPAPQTGKER